MTRAEAEESIMKHVKEVALIMKEYNADADYLSMTIFIKENYGEVNNKYYDNKSVDYNMPLNQHTYKLLEDIDD